jgi:hypothetical protein
MWEWEDLFSEPNEFQRENRLDFNYKVRVFEGFYGKNAKFFQINHYF